MRGHWGVIVHLVATSTCTDRWERNSGVFLWLGESSGWGAMGQCFWGRADPNAGPELTLSKHSVGRE